MDRLAFCQIHQMSAGSLDFKLKTMTEIHGWLNSICSHQLRYSGGKLLDKVVSRTGSLQVTRYADIEETTKICQ